MCERRGELEEQGFSEELDTVQKVPLSMISAVGCSVEMKEKMILNQPTNNRGSIDVYIIPTPSGQQKTRWPKFRSDIFQMHFEMMFYNKQLISVHGHNFYEGELFNACHAFVVTPADSLLGLIL